MSANTVSLVHTTLSHTHTCISPYSPQITASNGMRYVLIAGTTFSPNFVTTFVKPAASATALSTEDCAYQAALASLQFFSFNIASNICYGIAPTTGPFSDGSSIETATFDGTISIPNSDFVGTFDLTNVKQTEGLASRAQCQAQCLPATGCYIVDFSNPGGFCSFKAPTASSGWNSGWIVSFPASARVGGHLGAQVSSSQPLSASLITSSKTTSSSSVNPPAQFKDSTSASSSSPPIGAIVGGVAGVIIVVCAIAVAWFYLKRKGTPQTETPSNMEGQALSFFPANKNDPIAVDLKQTPETYLPVAPSTISGGASSATFMTPSSVLDEKRGTFFDKALSSAAPTDSFRGDVVVNAVSTTAAQPTSIADEKRGSLFQGTLLTPAVPSGGSFYDEPSTSAQRASVIGSKLAEATESSNSIGTATSAHGVNLAGLPAEPLAWTAADVDAFLLQNGVNDETRGALKDVSGRILLRLTVQTLKELYGISDRNQIVNVSYLVSKLNEVSGAGGRPINDHRAEGMIVPGEDAPPSYF
ncbi:hypothetical protein BC830DRAFT_840445 [Chytriomyces sp. MP71]|nr:hypothetical protein BC830DRAFT_840445 [Chytriomyces sp. MP71]